MKPTCTEEEILELLKQEYTNREIQAILRTSSKRIVYVRKKYASELVIPVGKSTEITTQYLNIKGVVNQDLNNAQKEKTGIDNLKTASKKIETTGRHNSSEQRKHRINPKPKAIIHDRTETVSADFSKKLQDDMKTVSMPSMETFKSEPPVVLNDCRRGSSEMSYYMNTPKREIPSNSKTTFKIASINSVHDTKRCTQCGKHHHFSEMQFIPVYILFNVSDNSGWFCNDNCYRSFISFHTAYLDDYRMGVVLK